MIHWSYWGNGMPESLSHITEEMAAASREARQAVLDRIPPAYAADVGETAHMRERAERAGIAAALAASDSVILSRAEAQDILEAGRAVAVLLGRAGPTFGHIFDPLERALRDAPEEPG